MKMNTKLTTLETKFGLFNIAHYSQHQEEGVGIVMGDICDNTPLVRVHSSCLLSETLNAVDCDCKLQLDASMQLIKKAGAGIIVYLYQEGRGAGLANKIASLGIMNRLRCDSIEAFEKLGLPPESRNYKLALKILDDLKVSKRIKLITNNPHKIEALEEAGYIVDERVPLVYTVNSTIERSLRSKAEKLGHQVRWDKLKQEL